MGYYISSINPNAAGEAQDLGLTDGTVVPIERTGDVRPVRGAWFVNNGDLKDIVKDLTRVVEAMRFVGRES